GVGQPPQRQVVRMQPQLRAGTSGQLRRHPHMVVVRVRQQDRLDRAIADHLHDRVHIVWRIDHHTPLVVPDHPDVVVDVERLAVQAERAGDDGVIDSRAHSTTTERNTDPECILSNACSTSPNPIFSVTDGSRFSRPCRYRSISIGKTRDGRQSPYHDDYAAPPRENTSISGSSNVMSGVGTPTRTAVPARSRA